MLCNIATVNSRSLFLCLCTLSSLPVDTFHSGYRHWKSVSPKRRVGRQRQSAATVLFTRTWFFLGIETQGEIPKSASLHNLLIHPKDLGKDKTKQQYRRRPKLHILHAYVCERSQSICLCVCVCECVFVNFI